MEIVIRETLTQEERNGVALAEHLKKRKRQTQAEMREAYLLNPKKKQLINELKALNDKKRIHA